MRMILEIVAGPFEDREHADLSRFLSWLRPGDSLRVGRSGFQADMAIAGDQRMSSGHFVISCEEEGCFVSDLESTNGTYVNGNRIEAATRLRDGDMILAGTTTFSVQIADANRSNSSLEIDPPAAASGADEPAAAVQFSVEVIGNSEADFDVYATETVSQIWLTPDSPIKIGASASQADLVIENDASVAPVHLTLEHRGAACHLEVSPGCDTIGVNNLNVRQAELSGGERITIGQTTLLLRAMAARRPAAAAKDFSRSAAAVNDLRHSAVAETGEADESEFSRHLAALSSGHRERVLEALRWFEDAPALDPRRERACQKLATFTRSNDREIRRGAAVSFARWTSAKGLTTLLQLLDSQDPIVLRSAIEALLRLGDLTKVKPIAEVIRDPARREAARTAIDGMGAAAERLGLRLLLDDDEQVQLEACRILEARGAKQSELALQAKLQRSHGAANQAVPAAAQRALDAVRARGESR